MIWLVYRYYKRDWIMTRKISTAPEPLNFKRLKCVCAVLQYGVGIRENQWQLKEVVVILI